MSKARIRKSLPTPLPIPSVEGPYGKASVVQHWYGFDFLDDANHMPTSEEILNRPARYFGMDQEDMATYYRAGRDAFLKAENEFNLGNSVGNNRLLPNTVGQYTGFGDIHSNNYEGGRKAPKLMPTWSWDDGVKFSSVIPTEYATRFNMSLEDMSRLVNFNEFGSSSFFTRLYEPDFVSKTFLHSTVATPGGTSVNEKFQLAGIEYPSVVLPSGDLLFYASGGQNTETGEQFLGLCIQDVVTGLISNFEVKQADGTAVQFATEPNNGESRNISLFVSNGNIFLSFNNLYGGYSSDNILLEGSNMNSRLFKIALDGTLDESFFPTIFRYERLLNIKNQLIGSKNSEVDLKNNILPNLIQVNGIVATITEISGQLNTLSAEIDPKISLFNSKNVERGEAQLSLNSIATWSFGDYAWIPNETHTQEEVDTLVALLSSLDAEISTLQNEIDSINGQIQTLIDQRESSISERNSYLDLLTAYNYTSKTEGYPQAEIDALLASRDTLNAEIITLSEEVNALQSTINSGIDGIQKFNALVNVHYVAGTTGAYYLSFDKLDEYGPLDADTNEQWQPISIGLLKVGEDGSNPVAIFKEDFIYCPRTEADGIGAPYFFSTGNVKKSLMLSNGDFILYTAETQNEGLESGNYPKFVKVSKEGVVDLSFTIDGYANTLLENADEMTPALDHSRLKVSVANGYWNSVYSMMSGIGFSKPAVNGMIEMEDGKILIYGSFANILTDKPVVDYDAQYDITHNIYDVGCFALLNADGSLDTEFNRTGEMSAEFYPIGSNPPAPWDNGFSFRPTKTNIAPVGFQYGASSSNNNGTLEITFAKVIGDKLYVSFKSDAMVSYNRTHILDGSKTYRLNLQDLTLDETFDFRYFMTVSDIVSTANGYRVYMSSIANSMSNQSNIVYNHRWILNNQDNIDQGALNANISHRAYSMKTDIGLGGFVREASYPNYWDVMPQWNSVGDALLSQCVGIFIFEVDEVNKSEITFHTPNEKVRNLESIVFSIQNEYNLTMIGSPILENKQADTTRDRFFHGLDLSELDLDRIDVFKREFRKKYTDETLWKDLASLKIEAVDGVHTGYTPLSFGGINQIGLNPGEYVLSDIIPQYFNILPAVPNMNILKGHTAVAGDRCIIIDQDGDYIFVNGRWVNADWGQYEDMAGSARGARDAKMKALNEVILSLKPFTFAAYHIPKANLDEYVQSL